MRFSHHFIRGKLLQVKKKKSWIEFIIKSFTITAGLQDIYLIDYDIVLYQCCMSHIHMYSSIFIVVFEKTIFLPFWHCDFCTLVIRGCVYASKKNKLENGCKQQTYYGMKYTSYICLCHTNLCNSSYGNRGDAGISDTNLCNGSSGIRDTFAVMSLSVSVIYMLFYYTAATILIDKGTYNY